MKPYTRISLGAALVLGCALTGAPLSSGAEQQSKGWGSQFLESMKKWEDKMSEVFRSATGKKAGDKSAYSASIDVREQSDHYTVRVHLPDRDLSKVKVTMDGHTLKIAGEGGYEQSIVLRNAASVALPHVQRLGQTLVITVPLGTDPAIASTKSGSSLLAPNDAEQDVLTRMENMRREMDRVFEDAFKDFRLRLDGRSYFDQPQFGSSIDLQDENDRYIIRAYLPGRDVHRIDVKVMNDILTIQAKAEQREKKDAEAVAAESFTMSSYSQSLTLPGPVQSDKMEVERKEGLLVITLPKKKS